MPTGMISHPQKNRSDNPLIPANIVVMIMPYIIFFCEIQPCEQALSGPNRSLRSLPFKKSYKSFTKLASICIKKANRKHNTAGTILKCPYIAASEHPVITGIAAPVSVLGRAANIQALNELGCIFSIDYLILVQT